MSTTPGWAATLDAFEDAPRRAAEPCTGDGLAEPVRAVRAHRQSTCADPPRDFAERAAELLRALPCPRGRARAPRMDDARAATWTALGATGGAAPAEPMYFDSRV